MLLFFYLIGSYLIFTLVDESVAYDGGFTKSWLTILGFVLSSLFVYVSGNLLSKLSLKHIMLRNFRKANMFRNMMIFLAFTMFLLLVFEFSWRHFLININIFNFYPGRIPVLQEILFILPAILNYYLIMLSQYKIDKFTRGKEYTFRTYFDFNFRLLMTPLPLIILISLAKYAYMYVDQYNGLFTKLEFVAPTLAIILVIVPVFLIALFFPIIIRFILRAKVLPQSEIRDDLKKIADEANVKYRNILIWQTGALRVPNAMVVGFFSWVRYVFITDTILNDFSKEEIQGVYAHEIGHAKHNHLLLYFVTLISFTFLSFLVIEPLSLKLGFILGLFSTEIYLLNQLVASLGIIFVFLMLIGFFSRRFEREADLFASKLIGFSNFIDALYGIARIYGGRILTKPSITHGSLQSRINFLYQAEYDQKVSDRFENTMKRFKFVFLFTLFLIIGLTAKELVSEFSTFQHKTNIYNAAQIVENIKYKGYLTNSDEELIKQNLAEANTNTAMLPEIQFVKAIKILETHDLKNYSEAKKLLESALVNPEASLYLKLNVQNTLEQLK